MKARLAAIERNGAIRSSTNKCAGSDCIKARRRPIDSRCCGLWCGHVVRPALVKQTLRRIFLKSLPNMRARMYWPTLLRFLKSNSLRPVFELQMFPHVNAAHRVGNLTHEHTGYRHCNEQCSVAITAGGKTWSREVPTARSHADMILSMIDEVLMVAKLPLAQMAGLAFVAGLVRLRVYVLRSA